LIPCGERGFPGLFVQDLGDERGEVGDGDVDGLPVLVSEPGGAADLEPTEDQDELVHLEVLGEAGFAPNPKRDEVVPRLYKGVQRTEKGVEQDAEALEAVGDFRHEVRNAHLLGFPENLKIKEAGAGAFTEVVINGEGLLEFGTGLRGTVRGAKGVYAGFEVLGVEMAEVATRNLLG
jgi:hypothetical protein